MRVRGYERIGKYWDMRKRAEQGLNGWKMKLLTKDDAYASNDNDK